MAAEQRLISFAPYAPESLTIHATIINDFGQLGLGRNQFFSRLQTFGKRNSLFQKLLLARLKREVALSKNYPFFTRVSILRYQIICRG